MQAFTTVAPTRYIKEQAQEYFWSIGPDDTNGVLAGSLLGNEIIRVRFLRGPHFGTTRYQLVDGADGTLPYHSWIVVKGDEQWSALEQEFDPNLLIRPYLEGFAFSVTAMRLSRPLTDNEHIFGLGERTGPMNKRGLAFPVWNLDYPGRHDDTITTMYTSIPFYIGIQAETGRAYGVLIDYTGQIDMDLGKSDADTAHMTVESDSLVVYFFNGPTPADVLRQYTELTGRMPLPASWTLGYHQCRWSYISEQQVNELAEQLRVRNHPCDGIWLDIDYMDGYRDFTWHPENFPNPTRMANNLHAQGFHLVTILDPGTKLDDTYSIYREGLERDYFCRYQSGEHYVGSVWPGASVFPDFSRSEVRTWWGNLYHNLLDQGVDGIWNDMNEPAITNALENKGELETSLWGTTMDLDVIHQAGGNQPSGPNGPPVLHKSFHNAYGMEMARTTYEGLLRLRPDSRPFVLTRSGTAGMQRYAALWTGDNSSRWEDISLAIRMCLNIGMSGVPFVGSDIGGFWDASNGELLVRFVQLGALLPFCRNHNALGNPGQEPWAFGEPYESAYRQAIETRYRLLPHLYTLFQQSTSDGSPVMRPLYYHYPQDEQACNTSTEFLVGDALLSAPVLEPGASSHSVYLPEDSWFDYWDGTHYAGNTTHEIAVALNRWPLFVRGNSILPTGPVMQYTNQQSRDPLIFTCYMTNDSLANYTLYEDDGQTQAYKQGKFALTVVSCSVDNDEVTVRIEEQHSGYQPQRQAYEIIVYVDDHVLHERVRAGQGTIVLNLSSGSEGPSSSDMGVNDANREGS